MAGVPEPVGGIHVSPGVTPGPGVGSQDCPVEGGRRMGPAETAAGPDGQGVAGDRVPDVTGPYERPAYEYRPRLVYSGGQWKDLYGDDIDNYSIGYKLRW